MADDPNAARRRASRRDRDPGADGDEAAPQDAVDQVDSSDADAAPSLAEPTDADAFAAPAEPGPSPESVSGADEVDASAEGATPDPLGTTPDADGTTVSSEAEDVDAVGSPRPDPLADRAEAATAPAEDNAPAEDMAAAEAMAAAEDTAVAEAPVAATRDDPLGVAGWDPRRLAAVAAGSFAGRPDLPVPARGGGRRPSGLPGRVAGRREPLRLDARGRAAVAPAAGARLPDGQPRQLPALSAWCGRDRDGGPGRRVRPKAVMTPAISAALIILALSFGASVAFGLANGGLAMPSRAAVAPPTASATSVAAATATPATSSPAASPPPRPASPRPRASSRRRRPSATASPSASAAARSRPRAPRPRSRPGQRRRRPPTACAYSSPAPTSRTAGSIRSVRGTTSTASRTTSACRWAVAVA